jgi:hypothetical protein
MGIVDVCGMLADRRAGSRTRRRHDSGGDRWHADEGVQLRRFGFITMQFRKVIQSFFALNPFDII